MTESVSKYYLYYIYSFLYLIVLGQLKEKFPRITKATSEFQSCISLPRFINMDDTAGTEIPTIWDGVEVGPGIWMKMKLCRVADSSIDQSGRLSTA